MSDCRLGNWASELFFLVRLSLILALRVRLNAVPRHTVIRVVQCPEGHVSPCLVAWQVVVVVPRCRWVPGVIAGWDGG